jgi:hypothetical protein
MTYVPKKFTSSSSAAVTAAQANPNEQSNEKSKKTSVNKVILSYFKNNFRLKHN